MDAFVEFVIVANKLWADGISAPAQSQLEMSARARAIVVRSTNDFEVKLRKYIFMLSHPHTRFLEVRVELLNCYRYYFD